MLSRVYDHYFGEHRTILAGCGIIFLLAYAWGLICLLLIGLPQNTVYIQLGIAIPVCTVAWILASSLAYSSKVTTDSSKVVSTPITRRSYWKMAPLGAAVSATSLTTLRIAEVNNQRLVPDAINVDEEAHSAIRRLSGSQQPEVDLKTLAQRANLIVTQLSSILRPPEPVVDAFIVSHAAVTISQIPHTNPTWVIGLAIDSNGANGGIHAGQDTFVSGAKFYSSLPRKSSYAIERGPNAKVVVFETEIDGLTQVLDGIVWIDVKFISCLIKSNGGDIYLSGVLFHNCVFDASISTNLALSRELRNQHKQAVTFSTKLV